MSLAANNFLNMVFMQIRLFFMRLFKEEKGAVTIVEMVVLIGIAVLLATLFRTQIEGLITALFGVITGTATEAVGGGN